MNLFVLKETHKSETRVALSPEMTRKYCALGLNVSIVQNAGAASGFSDDDYQAAGASLVKNSDKALKAADIVLCVRAPSADIIDKMTRGAVLIGLLAPDANQDLLKKASTCGVETLALELLPRITRAQSMDVLSSQANIAGYKAVIDGVAEYNEALPMMMTAAGTIPAARVFVMGAGVAGLQAIATARRLGAVVSATDVRAAAGEQVASLGAKFVMVEADGADSGETATGYAKEMNADYRKRQAALIAEHIAKQDIVICTALIPGRPAPELVSKAMVENMRDGAVIVDLAVAQGGNCKLSKCDELVVHGGVKIIGYENMPGRIAATASALYARNIYNFIAAFWDGDASALKLDGEDEIIAAIASNPQKKATQQDALKKSKVKKQAGKKKEHRHE